MRSIFRFAILVLLLSIILPQTKAFSQDSLVSHYIDINKVNLSGVISPYVSEAYINKNESLEKKYPSLQFTPRLIHTGNIPNSFVPKKIILKFHLCNNGDSIKHIWFFPGYFYWDVNLYKYYGNELTQLPSVDPGIPNSMSYRDISIEGHDSLTIIAELVQAKTYINVVRPRLISHAYLGSFISNLHNNDLEENILTYVVCGLLLMMILFSTANFFQGSNPEFLYYSGYAFFLGMLLFTKALLSFHDSKINFYIEAYLDFIMQGIGIIFYMVFMQKFLDTKNKYRFLYHLYTVGVVLLLIALSVYSYGYYFIDNFSLQNETENFTKVLLLVMVLIFLVYSIRHRSNRLLYYLFWGNLWLLVFSMISQASIIYSAEFKKLPGIFDSGLFYYETGLLIELIFFLLGLSYKNRRRLIEETKEKERLIGENKMMEYAKELAVLKAQQEERERISADMHDELGSGMTVIRLMSEIAKNKMKENAPTEISKISDSANEVLNKMNAIIWSMNSSNDTLDNLVFYIRAYALEYFENIPVHCIVTMPDNIPVIQISGDKRRNVFLSVKETLNNAIKHSGASEIKIDITINHTLLICITDNGIGINMQSLRQFGNGLKNISKRMESIGGSFKIENKGGTIVTLELPI